MATPNRSPQAAGAHVALNDLGPLAWVLDELRKSLDTASKALKRYVREAEQAKGSDLAAVDASQLRLSRQQLHQAMGALEMVGFAEAATMLRAMEAAVQKFVSRPELCNETAANKVERAGFALIGYLEAVVAGKATSAVTLFVPYSEVQELAGATRIHPADLWAHGWRWQRVPGMGAVPLPLDANTRAVFDKFALTFIKSTDLAACAKLCEVSAGIAKPANMPAVDMAFTTFWRISAAFFEAMATQSLAPDTYVKRTVSRILVQLATHLKGDLTPSERLAQDLLFFCAQAQSKGDTPWLGSVRDAYSLGKYTPVDYSLTPYGHFDPALLVQARKRISSAKESWSALTAGETNKLKAVSDQFALINDSISKLVPQEQSLSLALAGVAEMLTRQNQAPDATLGMEVATAILYLEAGFEEFDPADAHIGERVRRLAARVEHAKAGAAPQPLEPWMEELYRRVSDRQTMGSVVGELKITLGELEKSMDAFFRDPQDKVLLADVPARLVQMRGVLSVLGMDQASMAVMRMRDSVEQIMVTEIDEERARAAGTFDKLGNNLGALGFMIDMLSYQPVLAKKLFVFDDMDGELKPLMGRMQVEEPDDVMPDFEAAASMPAPLMDLPESPVDEFAPLAVPLDIPTSRPAAPARAPAAAAPVAPTIVDAEDVDPELLDIFLEEAREVAANGRAAVQALVVEPNNIGEMTTLRRAFHTLKGSSRMVGLNIFGEAAWSMEQVLNTWLAEQKPANDSLTTLSNQCLDATSRWIEDIASHQAQSWSAAPFRHSADALRLQGVFQPLVLDTAAAAPVEPAEPALAAHEPTLTAAASDAPSVMSLDMPVQDAPALDMPSPSALVPDEPVPHASTPEPAQEASYSFSGAAPLAAAATAGLALGATSLATAASAVEPSSLSLTPVMPVVPSAQMPSLSMDAVDLPSAIEPIDLPDLEISTPAPAETAPSEPEPSLDELTFTLDDAEAIATDAPANEISFDDAIELDAIEIEGELSAEQSGFSVDPSPELVNADELAAFERAMQELEAAETIGQADAAAHDFDAPPASVSTSEPGIDQGSSIEDIDLQALQSLSSAAEMPPVDRSIAATEFVASPLDVPELQSTPSYASQATQPMTLPAAAESSLDAPVSSFDLGFDLSGLGSPSGPALGATAGALGAMAGLTAAGAATASASPSISTAAQSSTSSDRAPGGFSSSGLMGLLPSAEEQFKAVGPLRISLPLYNVYLNEADEWSRRLVTSIEEWTIEADSNVPNDAVAYAHSLAGSSATVGFTSLSALARALEHALQHIQRLQDDTGYDSRVHSDAFMRAAEDIRALLHQFAAGFLKETNESTLRALARCMQAPEALTAQASIRSELSTLAEQDQGHFVPSARIDVTQDAIDSVAPASDAPAAPASEDHTLTASGSGFVDLMIDDPVMPVAEPQPVIELATESKPEPTPELAPEPVPAPVTSVSAAVSASPSAGAPTVTVIAATTGLTAISAFAALSPEPPAFSTQWQPEPAAESPMAAPIESVALSSPSADALGVSAPVLAVTQRALTVEETEDEIDVEDNIDPDLFEIFEDEAVELFPQMNASLREWQAKPGNTNARNELLRGLHTLKGSARMAGVLRLGEMAHRMETAAEQVPSEGASGAQIEPLEALLDGLYNNFEKLRNPQAADAPAAPAVPVAPAPASASSASAQATEQPAAAQASSGLTAASVASMPGLRPLKATAGTGGSAVASSAPMRTTAGHTVRVRAQLLDRLMNQAGEVMITRTRLETELNQLRGSLSELTGNLDKLRTQLRELDVQAESQMQTRIAQAKETDEAFDPLEFDRYTRVQELTRMMAESVNDVATVQRNIQRTVEATEDDLIAQARQTRDLQRDLLRTRMVEFEGISERLYRVVRQAAKDAGKQVKLDIVGGSIEMDRGVLERMAPAFEHLLRNCVAHGIEAPEARSAGGKDASGQIVIRLHQEGNDVSVEFRDDGAGLNIARIREKALSQGLIANDQSLADDEAANLIFTPGFSTATQVTELSGRGIGMDVVRSEVVALGGRIETATSAGQGTSFKLVLPLTTAVTQVVMIRVGNLSVGVPANLIEIVRRATPKELQGAYNSGAYDFAGDTLAFFWAGALLQHSRASVETPGKSIPVVVFRSAAQRIAVHVDEVLGNQEVVVKNLGPQLSRLPGLAGMTVMASGAVSLIYNPVALATVYGAQARALSADPAQPHVLEEAAVSAIMDVVPREISDAKPVVPLVPANPLSVSTPQPPLVLVVDDSITVRRVTQRLLQREGYRVSMAADGLQALERLAEELPTVVLSDIEMPRMDGFDLARNIKADEKLRHLPIIMITSRIAEKHREHAAQLGVQHYLGKPYSEEELLSLIGRYAREEVN
jgi:chemosensory pili system protein ChpA (sensor histidine kinase/response regulator)